MKNHHDIMKTQQPNVALISSEPAVKDPAAAPRKVRRAEYSPALRLRERAAANASSAAAVLIETVPSHPEPSLARWLARDADSTDLVNFPFAFTAFTILTAGLILIGWGLTVTSERLAVAGFLLTLVGGSFYGCSLFDD